MYYKIRQCFIAILIYESSAYYELRQDVITIYDSLVIPILDNCYYNLRQVVQFMTTVITIYDRYYISRHYYNLRQNTRA